jgi:hypothetical protein
MSVKQKVPGWNYEKNGNLSMYVGMSMIELPVRVVKDHVIDCYIDYEGLFIIHLKDELQNSSLFSNKHYQSDFTTDQGHIILYKIPDNCQDDLMKFIEGKYSKFSEDFIAKLYKYSGLVPNSYLFYAIRKNEILKQELEEYYDCEIPPKAEYLSKPSERNFKSFKDFFEDEIE